MRVLKIRFSSNNNPLALIFLHPQHPFNCNRRIMVKKINKIRRDSNLSLVTGVLCITNCNRSITDCIYNQQNRHHQLHLQLERQKASQGVVDEGTKK